MSAAIIAQLIIALGPPALDLIPKLAKIWHKEALTVEEIVELCLPAKKSYDDYMAEANPSV